MPVTRIKTSTGWQDMASGKNAEIYEQAAQPTEPVSTGAIWIDTDAPDPIRPAPLHFAGISPGRIVGDNSGNSGSVTTYPTIIYANSGQTQMLNFLVTPTEDCWWELSLGMYVRNLTGVWARIEIGLRLFDYAGGTKNDALGANQYVGSVFNYLDNPDYAFCRTEAMWALVDGQQYQCRASIDFITQGTWVYYRGATQMMMFNHGARPRY